MNKKKVIIITATVIALAAAGVGGMKYLSSKNTEATGRPVNETAVARDTIITRVTSKGEVSLLNTHLVYANLVAEVDEVLVEKNDTVIAGQPLLRYKEKARDDLQRSIERARLDVQGAELALNSAKQPPSELAVERAKLDSENALKSIERAKDSVKEMDTAIAKQEEKISEARKDFEINEKLLAVGAISQKTVDDEQKVLKVMEDELDSLKKQREYKERDVADAEEAYDYSVVVYEDTVAKLSDISTENNIKQQELNLQKARLALSDLEKELNDFEQEILSPAGGVIINVDVSRGEITPTSKALMEIADVNDYVIKVDVNERNAGKVEVGQNVELSGAVLGDKILTGRISKISTIAGVKQNNSGTERVIPVEITVDKGDASDVLKPGFSLDAAIITSVKENIIVVPILSTLSESDGSSFVYVIKDDNTLEKRPVTLGAYADMTVEVEGVSEGEMIVSQPTIDMEEGMAVTVTNREATEPQAGGDAQ